MKKRLTTTEKGRKAGVTDVGGRTTERAELAPPPPTTTTTTESTFAIDAPASRGEGEGATLSAAQVLAAT